jgi:hypothetical protein
MQYRRFTAMIVISYSWCIPFSFATQQDGLLHRWGSPRQHADLVWSPCSRCKSGSAHKRNSPSKALALLTVSLLHVISNFSILFSTHSSLFHCSGHRLTSGRLSRDRSGTALRLWYVLEGRRYVLCVVDLVKSVCMTWGRAPPPGTNVHYWRRLAPSDPFNFHLRDCSADAEPRWCPKLG